MVSFYSDHRSALASVGSYHPTTSGIHAMGKRQEWCHEWHGWDCYADLPQGDLLGHERGVVRVILSGGVSRGTPQPRASAVWALRYEPLFFGDCRSFVVQSHTVHVVHTVLLLYTHPILQCACDKKKCAQRSRTILDQR